MCTAQFNGKPQLKATSKIVSTVANAMGTGTPLE